jgi:hypothetical protein
MTLRSIDCFEIIEHTLGGSPGTPIEQQELVNHTGHIFVTMHPWKWLNGRMAKLTTRASIDITGASWVEATRTLTSAGSFTNYTFVTGDTILITAGTNTTLGLYEIESRVDNNDIILVTGSSLGATAAAIAGTMDNDQVELPTDFDFQRIIAYQADNALVNTMSLTTDQTMINLRSVTPGVTTLNFWAVLHWVRNNSGGAPVPRLEIWPPNNTTEEKFVIFYRGGWRAPATDDQALDLPAYLEPLFIELLKEVVRGHEMEDQAPLYLRLEQIKASSLFRDATLRDGTSQIDLGIMGGGASELMRMATLFANETVVADPT